MCTSEMSTRLIGGVARPSVQVTKMLLERNQETDTRSIEYYVLGIGYAGEEKGGIATETLTQQVSSPDSAKTLYQTVLKQMAERF